MTVVIVVVAKARRILKKRKKVFLFFFSGPSISSVLDAGSAISKTLIAASTVCLPHALGTYQFDRED